jgi:TatD DNase family protein
VLPSLIDAHCHLDQSEDASSVLDVLTRARNANVKRLVAVGAGDVIQSSCRVIQLAQEHADIWAAVGIHPEDAERALWDTSGLVTWEALAHHSRVCCIGEVGLDYYYASGPVKSAQQDLLVHALHLAKKLHLPIMFHIRDAFADFIALLDQVGLPNQGGVVHCFSGGPEEAQQCLERGLFLSISGIVTFKNAKALQEAVKMTPLSRLLIETDSPYLAPVPYRGKRNEPAYVRNVAEKVAELHGISLEACAQMTTQNAMGFFCWER